MISFIVIDFSSFFYEIYLQVFLHKILNTRGEREGEYNHLNTNWSKKLD